MTTLQLNEAQLKARNNICKYLQNPKQNRYLLLGPAGSGKTSVIVNAFDGSELKIAFCAFTNKATEVLRNIAGKFNINFVADFMTIHKLLLLEPKYLDKETEVSFKFDKTKIEHLKEYDVIIFDECSTVSKELYQYICEAAEYMDFLHNHKLKYIFLGDFWQLPPVGEDKSVIFERAITEHWLVSKLEKVMRSSNESMAAINSNLISLIPKIKLNQLDRFVEQYPYNLASKNTGIYLELPDFIDTYMTTWRTTTPDIVILTYSRANCEKTNHSIQDCIDLENSRPIPDKRTTLQFYAGDRCCLDRPIEVHRIKEIKKTDMSSIEVDDLFETSNLEEVSNLSLTDELYGIEKPIDQDNTSAVVPKRTVFLDACTNDTLYNGEIFDILEVEDVLIKTPINRFQYMPRTFDGQLLKIKKINSDIQTYEILHIPEPTINEARALIRQHERRMLYLTTMTDFIKKFPKLDYGYCITIYKSQGSEWHTVLVNLNSIKWSIIGRLNSATIQKKVALFKTTYTALSRASTKLYCFWAR